MSRSTIWRSLFKIRTMGGREGSADQQTLSKNRSFQTESQRRVGIVPEVRWQSLRSGTDFTEKLCLAPAMLYLRRYCFTIFNRKLQTTFLLIGCHYSLTSTLDDAFEREGKVYCKPCLRKLFDDDHVKPQTYSDTKVSIDSCM